eukprot:CAMPEP_0185262808 /NCGR_PEP_ID=MMETSP1359-20130426/10853_1 /TAXON_ID=552665 /ORGANISM="Bigelowiella longifila, Strain CCMP242" /LENGTH=141 /DNA_ID=CAMNT_0027849853 /DNA_START=53 /DNA_END=478 /DNA_ORIENTATION=+
MKSVALYLSVALNAVLVVCLVMAATRTNTLGAPVRVGTHVRPATFAKNAGMAAAVGGLSMMGMQNAPVHAQEFQRPQNAREYVMNQNYDFQAQAPQLVQQTAEVTPSLKRYFLSLLAGGGVVLGIFGALSTVAKFDQIDRQ